MLILTVVLFMILSLLLVLLCRNTCTNGNKESFLGTVDVVYTWVDTNDSLWRDDYNKYHPNKNNNNKRLANTDNSWDEIGLSIELVRRNIPWVNNIYVVTQRPQKLPSDIMSMYNVRIVHHDEIGLDHPTFNSMGIETRLRNIPGLSERFIYFNDDMYVTGKLEMNDFFDDDGKPLINVDNVKSSRLNKGELLDADNNYVRNLYKCVQILNAKGIYFNCPKHFPMPMTKTIYKKTEKLFQRYWDRTEASITRKKVNTIPMYLAASVGIHYGDAFASRRYLRGYYSENDIPRGNYDFVCINSITPDTFKEFSSSFSF